MEPTITKAVIPAAGFGTRFLPATKVVPKELMPIVDRPAIQYVVEEAILSGLTEIIFVLSRGKEQVANHFKPNPELDDYLKEREKSHFLDSIKTLQEKATFKVVYQDAPLGLGHAVLCAEKEVGHNPFFVFLPDDLIDHPKPCALQMIDQYKTYPGGMVAVTEVSWDEVRQYGIVKASPITSHLGRVENLVEKPKREDAPSNLAIIGRYLLPSKIFSYLKETKPGAIGEIQLTDALLSVAKSEPFYAYQFEGERFDVGNKLGFLEANIHFALNQPELAKPIKELLGIFAERR